MSFVFSAISTFDTCEYARLAEFTAYVRS